MDDWLLVNNLLLDDNWLNSGGSNSSFLGWLSLVGLNLSNQSSVFSDQSFELSGESGDLWIGGGVGNVLGNLGVRSSKKSILILFNNVESGFEFAQFRSKSGVSGDNRVESVRSTLSSLGRESRNFTLEGSGFGKKGVDLLLVVLGSLGQIIAINLS